MVPSAVLDFSSSIVDYFLSFFVCYRESFKDIPMADMKNANSVAIAVQTVRSLSFEIRVLLLTLR
jgi:hypothetical protein